MPKRRFLAAVSGLAGGLVAGGLLLGGVVTAQASPAATRVLGQPDFVASDCPDPPNAATMCTPTGIAIDPASGRLFVADGDNNRVLSWPSADAFGSGQAADLVLGQPDFSSEACADQPTAASLCYPQGVALDSGGRLFVADADNNRVLMWANAASASSGQAADRVLGQASFASNQCAESASGATLCSPQGVAVDPSGRLFVTDRDNNRVLSWSNSAGIANGQSADLVLGQSSFDNTDCSDTSANSLCGPNGLTIDGGGRLYVADGDNSRVLRWPSAAAAANGEAAALVLGQADFADDACNPGGIGAATLCTPSDVAVDSSGRLYVVDAGNNRLLSWSNVAAATNGQAADLVIGQATFAAGECADEVGATNFCSPTGVAVDPSRRVYLGDGMNNRVLVFEAN